MYKLEILHKCGKKVKTKSQKVLGASSYVCRSYRRKTDSGGPLCSPPMWIGLSDNVRFFQITGFGFKQPGHSQRITLWLLCSYVWTIYR